MLNRYYFNKCQNQLWDYRQNPEDCTVPCSSTAVDKARWLYMPSRCHGIWGTGADCSV